jgi:hypothetical protein
MAVPACSKADLCLLSSWNANAEGRQEPALGSQRLPPSLAIWLEDVRNFPSGKGRYYFPSRNVLRIYRISAADSAPYQTIQPQIKSLRRLLTERPTTVAEDSLPDYPPRNASHCFQEKLFYMDAAWGSALCYVTQFTQDDGPPANNEELTYLVQGLSKDGQFYVSADFSVTHPKLPNRIQDTRSVRRAIMRLIVRYYRSNLRDHLNHRSTRSVRGC